jgi:hypothetical protein
MSAGLSLTAAAGAMGIGRTTIHRWMDGHPDFRDSVRRGQAARTFKLEALLLEARSVAAVRFCCLALVNAAPEEWGRKRFFEQDAQAGETDPPPCPSDQGTANRPQHHADVPAE